MALKDWKMYRNEPDWITYENDNSKIKINIISYKPKYGFDVRITDISNFNLETKNFESKSQAINFAKKYMKVN